MIANGTTITFTVRGTTGDILPRTVANVRNDVIDRLTPFFDVASVDMSTSSILSDPLHSLSDWPYTAKVHVTVRADYGDIRDVDSVIANAFYNAAGNLPTVTADGFEQGQGTDSTQGVSLTTALVLVAVALVALAVIKVE
jgi:hypothetical protein